MAAADAAVRVVYTYGKLATASTLPHAVQAVITTAGFAARANVVATLSVTGATTFGAAKTVAALIPGASATVTFAAYPTTLAAAQYSQNSDVIFADQALPCGITVLGASGDGATWASNRAAPYSGTNAMRHTSALRNSQAANDWFFRPRSPLRSAPATKWRFATGARASPARPRPTPKAWR